METKSVLVVDDEKNIRMTLSLTLEPMGSGESLRILRIDITFRSTS